MFTPENIFQKRRNEFIEIQKRRNEFIEKYIEKINNFLILKYFGEPIIYEFVDVTMDNFNLFKKDLFDILKKYKWYVKELKPYYLNFKDYTPYAIIKISHKEIE